MPSVANAFANRPETYSSAELQRVMNQKKNNHEHIPDVGRIIDHVTHRDKPWISAFKSSDICNAAGGCLFTWRLHSMGLGLIAGGRLVDTHPGKPVMDQKPRKSFVEIAAQPEATAQPSSSEAMVLINHKRAANASP